MKNFAVIGCGRFGRAVAKTLYKLGYDVLAVDSDKEVIQQIRDEVTTAVTAEIDENVFRKIGVGECDVAVISIGSDIEASVIATIVVKELGVPYVVCKSGNEIQEKILYKIGADIVVTPEREMGQKVAQSLVSKNFIEKLNLGPDYTVADLSVPKKWVGKSIIDLDVRKNYRVSIIAIRKDGLVDTMPRPELVLEEDWKLILIGKTIDIDKIGEM
ncbi:potassium channel family protein [Criibacterium bergeronii]|uniref:TrkA family potassium uptake protein n=1 Tax=Criibacterium bergeronii TaxID=1871336 RepID=A0A371ILJ8_9FIRM|nr:TrkA family potassium uptake protein [Criibacterium bergeronii]RDY21357.1 TrkA family potassium uptake protein [Criibacterium bergeronii]